MVVIGDMVSRYPVSFCAFVAYAESRGCVEADTSALIVFTRWQTMLWTVCVVADVDTQRRNLLPVLDLLNWYSGLACTNKRWDFAISGRSTTRE